jgi:hypothetical protein
MITNSIGLQLNIQKCFYDRRFISLSTLDKVAWNSFPPLIHPDNSGTYVPIQRQTLSNNQDIIKTKNNKLIENLIVFHELNKSWSRSSSSVGLISIFGKQLSFQCRAESCSFEITKNRLCGTVLCAEIGYNNLKRLIGVLLESRHTDIV